MAAAKPIKPMRAQQVLLREVQRRLPAGVRLLQEAFTSEHRHLVWVKINELQPDTFYIFDEITGHAFADAVAELATLRPGGELTMSYTFNGELRAALHRLQRLAQRLDGIRVLAPEPPAQMSKLPPGVRFHRIAGTPLLSYRIALRDERPPVMFISRELPGARRANNPRSLGFFTFDRETIADFIEDIDQLLQGLGTELYAFRQLELLHKTTQQVARQLESYSRRMELLIRRAQRRPDLMTPARFHRVMQVAAAKMEELRTLPLRALQAMGKTKR